MEFIRTLYHSIYFNYFTFGSIVSFLFTFSLGVFLMTLSGRSKSTFHLGLAFFFMSMMSLGYSFAAAVYLPFAAYHRWFTAGFVLPAILHFTQWLFYFPEESNRRTRKVFQYGQWAIAILLNAVFIYVTLHSEKKFHFTGHYWDFDAEGISKIVAIAIISYIGIVAAVGVFRTYQVKTHDRWTILQITIALLIASVVPSALNAMSRDGVVDRGTYLTIFVMMTVLGFFFIAILYINTTTDRTSFMLKIVGVTTVTFLMLMQGMSYVTMAEKEEEFDNIRREMANRYLEKGSRNPDIQYEIELYKENSEVAKVDYNDNFNLDMPLVRQDFLNSILYEEILEIPIDNFQNDLKKLLIESHPEFEGYRNTILDYMNENAGMSNPEMKAELPSYFQTLNRLAFISINKISAFPERNFCHEAETYLSKTRGISHFRDAVFKHFHGCKWDEKELAVQDLKQKIFEYFRYFKPQMTRHYRKGLDGDQHFICYIRYFPETKSVKEVGFSYKAYRAYMHPAARNQLIILLIIISILIFLFPLFFRGSLVNPLMTLIKGVGKVNAGNLSVEVPVRVQDEIGYLSKSFNAMVASIRQARQELQDYADNLEEKVKERTREVQEKMDEVQKLKVQQDGDYFLTSLLAKPLFFNANRSQLVATDFIIRQKKKFEFRTKKADLGGDICVTGNLKFGTPDKIRKFTMAMNGDAMGKSMQGAGGCLVMGVVMNSIMARSAANKRILEVSPEQWLTDVYTEVNAIFKSFNGSMVISATVLLIEEETGEMLYWNAEHPFTILYRDGKAEFIEDGLKLRKLGLDSEYEFAVYKFQLYAGDTVLLGSDGRDDIDLTPNDPIRTINEDETMILSIVEEAKCDITEIERILHTKGEITDDLSFLKVDYKHNFVPEEFVPIQEAPPFEDKEISTKINVNELYQQSKKLYQGGEIEKALEILTNAYSVEQGNQKLNKLLGLLSFKGKDYEKAVRVLSQYLNQDPDTEEALYYLSVAQKKIGNYASSIDSAEKVYSLDPEHVNNLLNLSDLFRLTGDYDRAIQYYEKAIALDADNKHAKKLFNALSNSKATAVTGKETG